MLFSYSGIDGIVVIAFDIAGMRVSLANLRTSRLHSRRNPEAWYPRLTARPKVNTPCLFLSYSFVIYILFLSYIVYILLGGSCKGKMSLVSGNLGIAPPYLVIPYIYRSRNNTSGSVW